MTDANDALQNGMVAKLASGGSTSSVIRKPDELPVARLDESSAGPSTCGIGVGEARDQSEKLRARANSETKSFRISSHPH